MFLWTPLRHFALTVTGSANEDDGSVLLSPWVSVSSPPRESPPFSLKALPTTTVQGLTKGILTPYFLNSPSDVYLWIESPDIFLGCKSRSAELSAPQGEQTGNQTARDAMDNLWSQVQGRMLERDGKHLKWPGHEVTPKAKFKRQKWLRNMLSLFIPDLQNRL